ncbi:NAD(P)/FAD-dependent oxidoreductase [Rhizobium sp. TRM95796]|uniref:NAD(P)/FAD-dependent oxidoreductase n=1 Tax=Rhizobium sp. TRM95796 TaxID=2979862 RepID=UPI0021E7BD26|nr:NAD(P)/FAD-dependent oxidoreductase [Rhizobium sp. TRM95796]MCV3764815.1 NAD(P)/FAD-dependent oxidoreductase [Rhizobium sp. TRM95796]
MSLYDVVVIGGSYAGLAASLQLARARRNVLIVDAGLRRNRFASTSHGFLGQDGRPPAEIVEEARAQVLAYPNVGIHHGRAESARGEKNEFSVLLDDGSAVQARRLVLATGVKDILPEIPGLAERWGRNVFHCPYCHGYELDCGRIAVIAVGDISMHHALMLPDWGETTLFTNGRFTPDPQQEEALAARGTRVEHALISALEGEADIVLADGRRLSFAGVFTAPTTVPSSPIADQLGCAFKEGPLGRYIDVSPMMESSVAGVFACGDVARMVGSVSFAVGDGAMAGGATHRSLMFE